MRTILLIVSVLISQFSIWAQGVPTATLHHGEELKTFYSSTAFRQAIAEAQPGDIINLSAGSFNGGTIKVPVSVRGVGIGNLDGNTSNAGARTNVTGGTIIDIPESEDGNSLSMEGMECDAISVNEAYNPIFSKMRINSISNYDAESKTENLTFVHCILNEIEVIHRNTGQLFNCILSGFNANPPLSLTLNNCLINIGRVNSGGLGGSEFTYNNCIINFKDRTDVITAPKLYDCVAIGGEENTFSGDNALPERNNRLFPNDMKAFTEGTYYELTDDAAKYLGSDGKEVGLYGGTLPFSLKTNYPQIKKLTVAPESTADGKLKIEIEIDANN